MADQKVRKSRVFNERMLPARRVLATIQACGLDIEEFKSVYANLPKQTRTAEITALLNSPEALRARLAELESQTKVA